MARAVKAIGDLGSVEVVGWEGLSVAGRLLVPQITRAIDNASLACFEVTQLNLNVVFELGYAIGKNRRVWMLFESGSDGARRLWNKVGLLDDVGYQGYDNVDDIRSAFTRDLPYMAEDTLFSDLIQKTLQPSAGVALFYLPSLYETEPSRLVSRKVRQQQELGDKCVTADTRESSVEPLSWYAQQVYSARAVLAHLCPSRKSGSQVHNIRLALVCGMAVGMGRELLMLTEDEAFPPPVDYQSILCSYTDARRCAEHVSKWLKKSLPDAIPQKAPVSRPSIPLRLDTELQSLRLGEHIAEREVDALPDYFVETQAFREVLIAKSTLFIGRKGTGKSANFFMAASHLRRDKRNLVCEVRPYGYELSAVVRLLASLRKKDLKGYVVASLWRYLLLTEIARSAAEEIRSKPAYPLTGSPDWKLLEYVGDSTKGMDADFAIRLERTVSTLSRLTIPKGVEAARNLVNEALHEGVLVELRGLLGSVLSGRQRVAVVIDNLDQDWDRGSDIVELSHWLLGLLTAVDRLSHDFSKKDAWRQPVAATMAVFLRSDIYAHVAEVAREPDKLPVVSLKWEDENQLIRVVERRYLAARDDDASASVLWTRFFTPSVDGVPTREYLLSQVLPRPRDLVYLCNAAILVAVNAEHNEVTESDIKAAQKTYSRFALGSLRVENGVSFEELETVLYEFAGANAVMTEAQVRTILAAAGLDADRLDDMLWHLRALAFLGLEVKENQFSYSDDSAEMRIADVAARRLGEQRGDGPRLAIHPAFRPYLEVVS